MLSNPLDTAIEIASYRYEENPTEANFNAGKERTAVGDSLMEFMKFYLDDHGSRKEF